MNESQKETAAEITPEEMERCMSEPATRADMAEFCRFVLERDVLPLIDSKFAFLVSLMQLMFEASGAMTRDEFADVYSKLVDAFTEKYGDEETPPAQPADDDGTLMQK